MIRHDVGLSYKLLRYINSAVFAWRSEITSVRKALVLLGESEIRKWVSLVTMAAIADGSPPELAIKSVTRARMCEMLAHPLVVRRGFGLVGEGGSASADLGDDVVGGLAPYEGFGVVVPALGPHFDGLDESIELENVEDMIRHDVGLSYKLLRYINSAVFAWRSEITSVRKALVLLGESEIRIQRCRWSRWRRSPMAARRSLPSNRSHELGCARCSPTP